MSNVNPRRFLASLLVLAVLGGLLLVFADPFGGGGAGPSDDSAPPPSVREGAPAELARPGSTDREEATPTATGTRRAAADAAVLRIHVVDGDGVSVPGAELRLLSGPGLAQFPEPPLPHQPFPRDLPFLGFGVPWRADAAGAVTLPRPTERVRLAAGTATHWGETDWEPGDDPAIELVVERVTTVPVRVRDAAGAAVAGVGVQLTAGAEPDAAAALGVTDADGMAYLRLFPPILAGLRLAGRAAVRLQRLGPAAPTVVLDPNALPTEPVEFELDAVGAVDVTVLTEEGAPFSEPVLVSVTWSPADGGVPEDAVTAVGGLARDGRLRVPAVGLGLELRAAASTLDLRREDSTSGGGPRAPGEVVAFRLQPRPSLQPALLVLTGRIVNEEGRPARSLELAALTFRRDGGVSRGGLLTDSDGRFRAEFAASDVAAGELLRWVVEFHATRRKPQRSAEVAFVGLPSSGEADLGDVVLHPDPLLVAGRVLGPDGEPVPRAWVTLATATPDGTAAPAASWWREARTDAEGSFTFRGREPRPRIRLAVRAPGYLGREVETAPGTEGLEVRLPRGAAVRGSIRVDPGVPLRGTMLVLTPGDGERARLRLDDRGEYGWSPCLPGVQTLVLVAPTGEELWRGRVTLVAGETTRHDVDLRGVVHGMDLEVVDDSGQPLTQAWAAVGGEHAFFRYPGEEVTHHLRFPVRALPRLRVGAPGHRAVAAPTAPGAHRVVLPDGLAVSVVLDDLPRVPEDASVVVAVEWAGTDPVVADRDSAEVEGGRADFRLEAPGPWRVSLVATAPFDGTSPPESLTFDDLGRVVVPDASEPRTFHLRLGPERVEELQRRFGTAD